MSERCAGAMWRNDGWRCCTRAGSVEFEGQMWCKTHHPPTVELRRKARFSDWSKKQGDRIAIAQRRADALECLRGLVDSVEYINPHEPGGVLIHVLVSPQFWERVTKITGGE